MIVVCRNLRFLNNFPEISSKRSTSWNKFINVNTWSNATSANKPDPLSLVTESQSLPLDLLMCIKVVRGFIWTWSRLNMKCSIGPCWVLGAGPGGAVNTIITDYPPPATTSCLLPPTSAAHLHPVQCFVHCCRLHLMELWEGGSQITSYSFDHVRRSNTIPTW